MFKNLLQHSRVVSLPEVTSKTPGLPGEQVLRTTSASHNRRNWGLKHTLPAKAKSVLISHSGLDNGLGMPSVEYDASHARRIAKFSETGAAVNLARNHSETPSLFSSGALPKQTMRELTPKQRKKLLRAAESRRHEYSRYVEQRRQMSEQQQYEYGRGAPMSYEANHASIASSFMGYDSSSSFTTGERPSTAIGLSYALKGATKNTRDGLLVNQKIPGRVLPFVSQELASAAGFVGSVSNVSNDREALVSHQAVKPMYVTSAEANLNGTVSVRFSQEESKRR